MYAVAGTAQSGRVTGDVERAAKIQERLDALGISDREFQERTAINRKVLRRAANGESVRGTSYTAIETWLTRLERENAMGPETPTAEPLIRLRFKDIYGVGEMIAEGGDAEEVAAAVERVLAMLRERDGGS